MRLVSGVIRSSTFLAAVAALSGCVTTEQKNARTVLVNERELAAEGEVHVTRENPAVRVTAITLVRSGGSDAFAVTVVNGSQWDSMTASQFRAYQVLIIGDRFCGDTSAFQAAINDQTTWEPVVQGSGGLDAAARSRS